MAAPTVMQAAVLSLLVILAGQSNALGFQVSPAELPPEARTVDPMVQIWTPHGFEPMRPGVNTGGPHTPLAWGPEVAFARDWRRDHPKERLFILKAARGSTPLAPTRGQADWSPASKGKLFDATASMAQTAAAQAGVRAALVLWMQGEDDAKDPGRAQAYGANLAALFCGMRTRWGEADTRIVFGRIGQAPPYAAAVRAAQAAAAAGGDEVMVDTDDLPRQKDGLHLNGAGEIGLGDAFYRAVASGGRTPVAQPAEACG